MPTTPNCGMGGSTLTVSELRAKLENLPGELPVTITLPDGSWWVNISDVYLPPVIDPSTGEREEPSVMLHTTDDFDPRQF